MNYFDKYLKYKNKYLEQKYIQNGGAESYLAKLKELYPKPKHDNTLISNYKGHKITYGELTYEGIELLSKNFIECNFFLDIGSGRGKLSLYMACKDNIEKSIGIELVKERHDDAIQLKEKLNNYSNFISKVEFINDDIFNTELNKIFNKPVLVYISNLVFDTELNNRLFNKLSKELNNKSIIVCSKKHTIENIDNLEYYNKMLIDQSWNKKSNVYIYKLI